MKLTKQQNSVIWCLQNGWVLLTSSEMKGAILATNKLQFEVGSRLFWNLVEKGLIYQGNWWDHRFNYVLTSLGKTIKTKEVKI